MEEGLIIFSDNSIGFILELSSLDISCKHDEFVNHLSAQVGQFLNGLPQFLDLQIVQEIDQGNEVIIKEHECLGNKANHALTKLVLSERVKRFQDLESINALPKHRLKLIARRKIQSLIDRPKLFGKKQDFETLSEVILSREVKATQAIRDNIIVELQSLGVGAHFIHDKEIYDLLYWQWNPGRTLPPREKYDPSDIRNEILFSDVILNDQGFVINGIHHRVLSLKLLPDHTFSGMAEKLRNLPFSSRLFFSIHVPDQQKEIEALKMQRRVAFSMISGKGAGVRDLDSEAKFQDLETLLSELIAQGERVFQIAVNVVLRSPSEDELISQATETLSLFRELSGSEGMQESLAAFDLFTGFSMPNARASERIKRMKTSTVADLLPIYGVWGGHDTPTVLLRSRLGGLIKFDPFSPTLSNFNHVISGGSGSGKSFLTNLLLLQLMKEDPEVYIVDIGGSYKKLSDLLGGQYIPLGTNGNLSINPFDLSPGETEPSPEKVKFLVGLVELMTKEEDEGRLPRLTRAEIEEAIFKVYERVKTPRLSDLKEELEKHVDIEIRRFSRILSSWCGKSAYGEFVDRETTIHLDKKLVCFDLKGLEGSPDLQKVCLYLITDYVWREVQRDRGAKKFLIFDECWKLLENDAGSTFIAEVYRTFRKYYASAIAISQNMDDFAKSKVAGAILSNSATKWCLSQKGADQERLKEVLQLNDNEMHLISSLTKKHGIYSEAFLMCGDDRSVVSIESTPLEYWIATTDARDLSKIEEVENNEPEISKIAVLIRLASLYPEGMAGVKTEGVA